MVVSTKSTVSLWITARVAATRRALSPRQRRCRWNATTRMLIRLTRSPLLAHMRTMFCVMVTFLLKRTILM